MHPVLVVFVLLAVIRADAAPAPASAPATSTADGMLDFGTEGLVVPPIVVVNGHSPRTAQLLGEAYRRRDPLVSNRVQYVADLGAVALPAGAPYLLEAMKDPAAAVRAEAARAAARVGDESLFAGLAALSRDADADVRREAMLASMSIARAQGRSFDIAHAVSERQTPVIAAALQVAWAPEHAALVAKWLPALPQELKAEAADALARIKSTGHARALLPLLKGEVEQRVAAVRALGECGGGDDDARVAITATLKDPHPSVRREAMRAIGKLAPEATRESVALGMLADGDPTVREAAARVLTPAPSPQALAALLAQLDHPYAPLHAAARDALARPRDAAVREATIVRAAGMLAHENPQRREDASYLLGGLRSDAAFDRHVALLAWDASRPAKSDWPVIAQAAESLGLIGDVRCVDALVPLVKAAPEALDGVQRPQRDAMAQAMANALVSAARLRHQPAIAEAVRILELHPDTCPPNLRAAAAFAIGVLTEPGSPPPPGANLLAIYESMYEPRVAKIEAIKALGNMRHADSADGLKKIAENDLTPDLRWLAHWAYERASKTRAPYTPPTERRVPPVSVADLLPPQSQQP